MNKEIANQILREIVSGYCYKKDSALELVEGVKDVSTETNGNVVITLDTGKKLEVSIVVR